MAAALTATITATLTGTPTGTKTISIPVTVSTPVDASTVLNLSSGANTITPPVGATVAVIIPPAANAVTMTLKGITGDTGVPLSLTNPSLISLASAAAFVITTGGTINGVEVLYF